MPVTVGSAIAYLELNLDKYTSGFNTALGDLDNFKTRFASSAIGIGTELDKIGTKAVSVGKTMTMAVTGSIIGAGAAVYKLSSDFEASMSGVQALLGVTGDDMEVLRAQAMQLGADTAFSAQEAADGMSNLASAGFSTEQIMAAMPGLLDLAASSGAGVAVAADIASSALNGFGLEAADAGRVADVLAKASADTNASVTDLGESMKYVAPIAQTAGWSLENVSAALGIMANAGIKGSQAGTTLRGVFSQLAKPSKEAAGLMTDMGFAAYGTDGKMKDLTTMIADLTTATSGMSEEERNYALTTIFGSEALSGLSVMMAAGSDTIGQMTTDLGSCNGAAKSMADVMTDNLKGSVDEFTGSVETAAIGLGTLLTPKFRELVDLATILVNKFNAMNDSQKTLTLGFSGVAAAAGPAVMAWGYLSKGLGSVATSAGVTMEKLNAFGISGRKAFQNTAASAGTFFNSIKELAPMKALSSGFETLQLKAMYAGDGIKLGLGNAVSGIGEKFSTLSPKLGGAMGKVTEGLGKELPKVAGVLGQVGGGVTSGLTSLVGAAMKIFLPAVLIGAVLVGFGALYEKFGTEIDAMLQTVIEKGPAMITEFVSGILAKLPEMMTAGTSLVTKLLEAIIANLPAIVQGAAQILSSLVLGVANAIPQLIPVALDLIATLAQALVDNLPTIVEAGLTLLMSLAQSFADNAPKMIDTIINLVLSIVKMLISNLPMIIEAGIKILVALIQGISKALPELIKKLPEIIKTIIDAFKKVDWATLGKAIIDGLVLGLSAAGQGLWDALTALCDALVTSFKAFFGINSPSTVFADFGNNLIQGLIDGISAMIDLIVSTFAQIGQKITDAILAVIALTTGWGKDIINGFADSIIANIDTVVDAAGRILTKITEVLGGLSASASKWAKDMLDGFIQGIKDKIGEIGDAAKAVADKVTSYLHFSTPDEGPLRDYENWMPDMMMGLTKGIRDNMGMVTAQMGLLSQELSGSFDPTVTLTSALQKPKLATAGGPELPTSRVEHVFPQPLRIEGIDDNGDKVIDKVIDVAKLEKWFSGK